MKNLSVLLFTACFTLVFAISAKAQQEKNAASVNLSLVRLLQSKGILTGEEAALVSEASTPSEAQVRLAKLLLVKGLIDQNEFDATLGVAPQGSAVDLASSQGNATRAIPAVLRLPPPSSPQSVPRAAVSKPAEAPAAAVIPAIAPLRLLPITPPKKDGLLPDIKLGAGARLRPYGLLKASAVHQTVQNGGAIFGSNDFSFGPLLLADTGPDNDSNFHLKARSSRVGVDFEWPDLSKNLTLTGKLEFDFEGNFTNVNNRNISSTRSSQPSIRLAFARLDTKIHDRPVFFQFGQDWSLFTSSTLVDMFETTFFGAGLGNLYERMPMFRTGIQFGSGKLKIQPEFALALPSFGEASLSVDQRTRFGGRVGAESGRPEYQTRLVLEYPVFESPGVAPAQLIFSYDNARRAEIFDRASLTPTLTNPLPPSVLAAFPNGLRLESSRNAWDMEVQLPTPWATVVGKYYRGGDLRFFFGNQLNEVFADLGGASPLPGTATGFSGRTIQFGSLGGAVVAPTLEPIQGQGGFLQLGLPLSRLFHANPTGRNAGWSVYFTYGLDSAFAKDARRGNGMLRSDYGAAQLRYKLNKWVTFVHEETYIDTHVVSGVPLKLFRGNPARTVHAWRTEFGTIFAF